MLPLSLYQMLFKKEWLWYGDEIENYCTVGKYQIQPILMQKINSTFLKKLGILNLVDSSSNKNILTFPYVVDGIVVDGDRKSYKTDTRDYINVYNYGRIPFFYIKTLRRLSWWNISFIDAEKIADKISKIYVIFKKYKDENDISRIGYLDDLFEEFFWFISNDNSLYSALRDGSMESCLTEYKEEPFYKKIDSIVRQAHEEILSEVINVESWLDVFYPTMFEYALNPWENDICYETMVLELPVLRDWREFKQTSTLDYGELESRAEYLFSFLDESLKIFRTYYTGGDLDSIPEFPQEKLTVHFSLYLKEVDEVLDELMEKYSFSQMKKILFLMFDKILRR